jgi:acetolactate synthase I/II/III large subunit
MARRRSLKRWSIAAWTSASQIATGAADGYGRIAGKPAATLLHLGPGLANGLANLHNARRAASPIVNVVGDRDALRQGFPAGDD